MVTSNQFGPEQALRVLEESMKKRDFELNSLKEQLAKLREELDITAAERDHLRTYGGRKVSVAELAPVESEDGEKSLDQPNFAELEGKAHVAPVEDDRLGKPKRVLVIGGGPAGLISLHELLNPINRREGQKLDDFEIQLYERRAEVGGVWYFEPENDIAKGWHHGGDGWHVAEEENGEEDESAIQNGDSQNSYNHSAGDMEMMDESWWKSSVSNGRRKDDLVVNNGPKQNGTGKRQSSSESADFCYLSFPQNAPRWPSPAYEGLVGNVLPPLLEFSATPFPKPQGGLFPSQVETHKYLLGLAEPLRPFIKTCQEVIKAEPKFHPGSQRVTWVVTKVDWSEEGKGQQVTEEWDAIITAAGAFDHPWWPDMPGLTELRKQKSPLIMHAKSYPGPRPFVNQHNKIVVVGNANSANDIAAHLAPLNSSGPLYRSIRHESKFAHLPDGRIKDVPPIINIKQSYDRQTLNLELEDGTKLEGITKLIFASGYQFAFQWLKVPSVTSKITGDPSSDDVTLVSASKYGAVPYLHNATFLAAAPTIAFVGLQAGSTPMPMAEIQARVIARTWNNVLRLPPTREELLKDYEERAAELDLKDGDPTNWRVLHMIRGQPERKLTADLLGQLEDSENGASEGLFRWDAWREGVVKTMRSVKEGELRRLRNARVAAGGVDGGIGGVLSFSYGPSIGQKFTPVFGDRGGRGKSLGL